MCRRPAVSTISRSAPRALAALAASNATEAGSAPSWDLMMSTPLRSAQMVIWSIAAARKVSHAAISTFCPDAANLVASLPMVVVLPTPFTPTINQTAGLTGETTSASALSRPSSFDISCCSRLIISSPSVSLFAWADSRTLSISRMVAFTPTSASIRICSISSRRSSSIFRLDTTCVILPRILALVLLSDRRSFSNEFNMAFRRPKRCCRDPRC